VRSLPNGLRVVMLPITSVPTVDVRLVFRSGTADELPGARGAALVAADALSWRFSDSADLLMFLAAGGNLDASVDLDRTTFSARGLDMHVDLLLTGIARLVRDGEYGSSADMIVASLRRQAKKVGDEGALTDSWRSAIYGASHPYVDAGLPRHASRSLAVADAERFRAAHFNPDNATLIIAGKFDSMIADEWVDYLFGSWEGVSAQRQTAHAVPQAASLARADDTSLVSIAIALPAAGGNPAEHLVAAEMLNEIASDVRFELGASYELSAALAEQRLATNYVIAGSIDAGRAAEGLELVQKRIAELTSDPDAAARAFVGARQRVLVRLMAVTGGASLLAARVEEDVAIGREPNSEIAIAEQTRRLSVDGMAKVLADLDLRRASVMMRGPEEQVRAAYAVLGRQPTFIAAPAAETVASHVAADRDDKSEQETIDTTPTARLGAPPSPPPTLSIIAAPGYSTGNAFSRDASGGSVAVDAGWRDDEHGSFGVHTSFGHLSGQFVDNLSMMRSISVTPIDVSVFVRGTAADRVWGVIALGIHYDTASVAGTSKSDTGLGIVLEAGIDVYKHGAHHVGLYGRVDREMAGDANYEVETLGVAYRR